MTKLYLNYNVKNSTTYIEPLLGETITQTLAAYICHGETGPLSARSAINKIINISKRTDRYSG